MKLRTRIRLRYRLWRIDQAKKMTAERAGHSGGHVSGVYALKHDSGGGEWIQEFDSRDEAVRFQSTNGGVLMKREEIPGQPGLWWVDAASGGVPGGD